MLVLPFFICSIAHTPVRAVLTDSRGLTGCMAALEAEHFLQEHEIQQGKAEPTPSENDAAPDNGHAPTELAPV